MPELTRRLSADHRHKRFTAAMFMSARLPSVPAILMTPIRGNGTAVSIRLASGRTSVRHRRHLRRCPRGFREDVASVLVEPHRGRFSGMARTARLDRTEICTVVCWQAAGAAQPWTGQAVQPFHEESLRRGIRSTAPRRCWYTCLTLVRQARRHRFEATVIDVRARSKGIGN
jgi:hypothetical protein